MPAVGLEPTLRCRKQILSLPRLPIPTRRLMFFKNPNNKYHIISISKMQHYFLKKVQLVTLLMWVASRIHDMADIVNTF